MLHFSTLLRVRQSVYFKLSLTVSCLSKRLWRVCRPSLCDSSPDDREPEGQRNQSESCGLSGHTSVRSGPRIFAYQCGAVRREMCVIAPFSAASRVTMTFNLCHLFHACSVGDAVSSATGQIRWTCTDSYFSPVKSSPAPSRRCRGAESSLPGWACRIRTANPSANYLFGFA